MRIGIFGGSFDPIHTGHLIIAEYAREFFNLDKVIFIPVGIPSHRENKLASNIHRFNMINLAIKNNPNFEVSDIELINDKENYTYDTFLKLRELYKEDELIQIIGEDSADYLHLWKNYEELIKMCKFLVFRRENYSYISKNPNILVMDSPKISLSATFIRERIRQGKSIKYMVANEVEDYIKENRLYINY